MLELHKERAELKATIAANESVLKRVADINTAHEPLLRDLLNHLHTLEIDSTQKRMLTGLCLRLLETQATKKRLNMVLSETETTFILRLEKKHPNLNNRELRICLLIKMGYDNEEIAERSGIKIRGMESIRYRIHKKLSLGKHDAIKNYLANHILE
jgi:DNA-binding CsgD family transcriptional regulator